MDRSQQILSAIDELRQIRTQIRLTESIDSVRTAFTRVQEIRRQHIDEFDLQITIADVQQEIIDRARLLRQMPGKGSRKAIGAFNAEEGFPLVGVPQEHSSLMTTRPRIQRKRPDDDEDVAEIPAEVPKLDRKSWQVAMGLAAVFTVALCVLFFYLIQTARHINFEPDATATAGPQKPAAVVDASAVKHGPAAVSMTPTLRLYTDLIPGTVTVDEQPEQTLVDGEFNLDNIRPGEHDVKVAGRSGSASFKFVVDEDQHAPHASALPVSNNAMVVLVSVDKGRGRLVTDASGAEVSLDGKASGSVGPVAESVGSAQAEGLNGLDLEDLGTVDHELEVSQARDKQKFVLTYTPAPAMTVFVKSDPSTGMLTVITGEDNVTVFINDTPHHRLTEHGRLRVPLKVDSYRIRIHKDGYIDPPAAKVDIRKAEEASVIFRMQTAPDFATLQIRGAQAGTTIYVDSQLAATVGVDGSAKVVNIKSGDHVIELHHDQAVTRQLTRSFTTGGTVILTGADVMLDRLAADGKSVIPANPGGPMLPPPSIPASPSQPPQEIASATEVVHKGGGFVPYRTPRTPGHYSFEAHTHIGGLLKHGKLQWYAGYQDKDNYVLFTVDGKHAAVREVRDGKAFDLGKIPFDVNTDEWVQVDVTLKPDSIQSRVKTPLTPWCDLRSVPSDGQDFTKAGIGLYIPSNDEVAVANYRFTGR